MRTRFSRDRNDLLRVVVSVEFGYATGDCGLLSRAQLTLAALVGIRGGAFLILWVDGDFGGVIASIDYISPSWRHRSGRVGEHFDVRHGCRAEEKAAVEQLSECDRSGSIRFQGSGVLT